MNTRAWQPYTAEGDGYIPVSDWGRDHWSTLAYVETCTVDGRNILCNARMRTNPRLHRELVGVTPAGNVIDGSYPTRLREDRTIERHDDWSCLEDMVFVGFVAASFRVHDERRSFGGTECKVNLTPEGVKAATALRNFKRGGGAFSDFVYTTALIDAGEELEATHV